MSDLPLEPRVEAKIPVSLRRLFGAQAQASRGVLDTRFGRRPHWTVRSPEGTYLGQAMVDDVPGKSERITILVATAPDGTLRDLEILAYREAYGGEVAQEAWRAQFRGRKAGDPLRVGRQVRNVSGATISTNSVTAGVARCLAALAASPGGSR